MLMSYEIFNEIFKKIKRKFNKKSLRLICKRLKKDKIKIKQK